MTIRRRDFGRVAAAVGLAGCSAARRPKPNVLIVQADDLRATAVRPYNEHAVATPNLDRVAAAGVLFEHCYTPHPLCCPARVSLWTGEYSSTHGSRHNQKPMSDGAPNMAASFHAAGYRLGLFGKNHCFTAGQLRQWFETDCSAGSAAWKAALSPGARALMDQHSTWLRDQGGALLPPAAAPFPHEIYATHLATERAIEFLDRKHEHPFLMWVSMPDPHTPIEVPEKFANALPAASLKMPPFRRNEIDGKNTRMQIFDYLIRGRQIPDEYLARYLSIYSGKTAFVDYELGRLLDALQAKGHRDTIVLFTSDNGDFAGEHHLMVKTGSLVDSMVRMPLAISWPGVLPAGGRESALVNQVDIAPTLLALCGLPPLAAARQWRLPLAPESPRRQSVYSEYGGGDAGYGWTEARALGPAVRLGDYALTTSIELAHLERRERAGHLRMIRTETHKIIADSNGEVEFYDLKRDPWELDYVHGRSEYREAEQQLTKLLPQAAIAN